MGDLIRRSDAIKAIMNKPAWHGSEGSWFHSDDIKDAINSIPAVEQKRGEVNAVKEYEDAIFQLEHNKINLGEYESLIEPLKHLYAAKPYTEKMMVNGEEIDIDPISYEVGLTKGMMESQPKQGKWKINNNGWAYCSECESLGLESYNFCPYCGAKMKGAYDEGRDI